MNSPSDDDKKLAALLQANSIDLPDGGFSQRVLAALPAKRRSSSFIQPFVIGAIGGIIGLVFALSRGASFTGLSSALETEFSGLLTNTSTEWLALGIVLSVFSLLLSYLFLRSSQQRF